MLYHPRSPKQPKGSNSFLPLMLVDNHSSSEKNEKALQSAERMMMQS